MPPPRTHARARARGRARPRCTFVENDGSRCRRNATGTPPMCQAHWLVVDQEASPGRVVADVLRDLINGQRPPRAKVAAAASVIFDVISGAARTASAPNSGRAPFTPPAGWVPPPGWMPHGANPRHAPPPPPPPICRANECPLCVRARKVLGLASSGTLTPEIVKAQHRKLARKHHPDLGGRTEDMQKINAAVEQLERDLAA